ncbi:MAG TPA: hypothetical protein VK470_09275, partial [Bacteroidota bacterium]|nr:hypothetical protein [Bacteroidota bacterium]
MKMQSDFTIGAVDARADEKSGAFRKNFDAEKHVRGESVFVDDIPAPEGTLYAHVYYSRAAHGTIRMLDVSAAKAMPGVTAVLTADDIPGRNEIGG